MANEDVQVQRTLSPEEVKQIIVDLYKKGYSKAIIGQILKEQYGIYDVRQIFGKKLTKVLEDAGIKEDIPEDLLFLLRKAFRIIKHLEKNKKDVFAARALMYTESKIKRLIKYYIRTGKLPKNFRYTKELVRLYGSS